MSPRVFSAILVQVTNAGGVVVDSGLAVVVLVVVEEIIGFRFWGCVGLVPENVVIGGGVLEAVDVMGRFDVEVAANVCFTGGFSLFSIK